MYAQKGARLLALKNCKPFSVFSFLWYVYAIHACSFLSTNYVQSFLYLFSVCCNFRFYVHSEFPFLPLAVTVLLLLYHYESTYMFHVLWHTFIHMFNHISLALFRFSWIHLLTLERERVCWWWFLGKQAFERYPYYSFSVPVVWFVKLDIFM